MSDSTETDDNSKPLVLVLGGCGFIGRNLIEYLITNDLVSAVRAVDKTPPQLAFMNSTHTKVFEDPRVEYRSANLINPTACQAAMAPAEGAPWALAVNCAGETRVGRGEALYAEGITALGVNVARAAADLAVPRLVEISCGQMYADDEEHDEDEEPEPWTVEARMKLGVERELRRLSARLDYVVLRVPLVYGVGDRRALTPRLVCAAACRQRRRALRLPWGARPRLHTLHARDLARLVWRLRAAPAARHAVLHAADDADSTHGSLAALAGALLGVRVEACGAALAALARRDVAALADAANEEHLAAWAELCAPHGVPPAPLEPLTAPDALRPRQLRLRTARLRRLLPDWRPLHPRPTPALLREVLQDFVELGLFPPGLLVQDVPRDDPSLSDIAHVID